MVEEWARHGRGLRREEVIRCGVGRGVGVIVDADTE